MLQNDLFYHAVYLSAIKTKDSDSSPVLVKTLAVVPLESGNPIL